MSDLFYSPKRRLARAKKHAAELEVACIAFINSNPYGRFVDLDSNGITKIHKVKLIKPFPEELSDIAADAFDNLRSALDQTVYSASKASGKTPSKFTCFPFSDSAEHWENRAKGGICKDVASEIVELFRAFRPYKGGSDALWALNELRNVNQHALLVPLGMASVQGRINRLRMEAPPDGTISFNLPLWNPTTWDSDKNEMIMFREDPGGSLEYDIDLTPFVAFGDVVVFGGEPVLKVFGHLAGVIEGILNKTEAECRRLGFIS